MTTATDDFTRSANETPAASPWAACVGGGMNIDATADVATSTSATDKHSMYDGGLTWGNDQTVSVIVGGLTASSAYASVNLRMDASGNGFTVYTDGSSGAGHTEIAIWTSGVAGSPTSIATTFSAGDELKASISGSTGSIVVTAYKNGTQVGQATGLSGNNSGKPGTGAYGTATVDNFSATDGVASSTADQEGARFGNDDGSESAHTFAAAQDANLTAPLAQNVLVRAIVDGTGDLPSTAFTLRYQKNGSGGYVAVPVGASVAEQFGTPTFGAVGTGANGSTTVAPSYPAGITAGDYLLAVVTSGATNSETPSDSGSKWGSPLATGASTDGTFGIDTGPRRVTVFGCIADGTETGTYTFNITNGNTCRGTIYRFSKSGSGTWQVSAQGGDDSTSGTGFSVTTASINWNTGDIAIVAVGQRVDTATQSAQSLTASGVTFGARTNRATTAVTTGNDHRHVVDTFANVTGTSNVDAAPTWAYTASAACSGGCVVVRLREYTAASNNELYVATSANIAAGGEATTARLTAPSGKTTADFVAGRRWDDENGADSIDVTTDDYTEVEWCLQAQSPAANGDYFDFRVYAGAAALDTYSVTPRWTIGTASSPSDVPYVLLKQPNAAARLNVLRRF